MKCPSDPPSKRADYYRRNAARCKEASRLYRIKNREALLLRRRELRKQNAEKTRQQARERYHRKRDEILARRRALYRLNPPKRNTTEEQKASSRERTRRYRAKHRDRLRREERHRLATQPAFKFSRVLRSRVGKAVKSQYGVKAFKTMEVIGCGMQELLAHLEKQFLPGMGWHNYGRNGWHIDHVIPCAAFDLSQPEHQKKCFHFSNLRPVWARQNESKASRIEGELPIIYRHKKTGAN